MFRADAFKATCGSNVPLGLRKVPRPQRPPLKAVDLSIFLSLVRRSFTGTNLHFGEQAMRFIITAQSSTEKETTKRQSDFDVELFKAYMRFNEEMHQAGVLVASEGLNPSAPGARIAVANGKRYVVDGPFAESKELVGGFYLVEVSSLEEAIQWALRAPSGFGSDDILEIRQLTGSGDLPAEILKLITEAAPTWSASAWQSRNAN